MRRHLLARAALPLFAILALFLVLTVPSPAQEDNSPAAPEGDADVMPEIDEPDSHTAPEVFSKRRAQKDFRTNRRDERLNATVRRALDWLKFHQDPEGHWDCNGFQTRCRLNVCGGTGSALYDPGVTGLALLAFLGTGETPFDTANRDVVKPALSWILSIQDVEGCYGKRTTNHFTYNHAICTQAIAEAYGLSGSPALARSLERAVAFIGKAQNPYLGWRYGVRPGDNSTSATCWMTMALFSAKAAGIEVPASGFEGALAWFGKVTEPEYGRVGYTSRGSGPSRAQDLMDLYPSDKSESTTAMALFSRVLLAEEMNTSKVRRQEPFVKGCALMEKCLPEWSDSGTIDMIYWHFGALTAWQAGGGLWKKWDEALRTAVIESQRRGGDENGSWDPAGPWGRDGGRVYSTAMMALTCECRYRYPVLAD